MLGGSFPDDACPLCSPARAQHPRACRSRWTGEGWGRRGWSVRPVSSSEGNGNAVRFQHPRIVSSRPRPNGTTGSNSSRRLANVISAAEFSGRPRSAPVRGSGPRPSPAPVRCAPGPPARWYAPRCDVDDLAASSLGDAPASRFASTTSDIMKSRVWPRREDRRATPGVERLGERRDHRRVRRVGVLTRAVDVE